MDQYSLTTFPYSHTSGLNGGIIFQQRQINKTCENKGTLYDFFGAVEGNLANQSRQKVQLVIHVR